MKLLVLNGPNLNLLGLREPEIYGKRSYAELERCLRDWAAELGLELEIFQSNHEGALVDKIQEAFGTFDGILFNPAAYTHTSVALLDALKAVGIPTVEVHLSDPDAREAFRRVSYVRAACLKTFSGLGFESYRQGMAFLASYLRGEREA